VTLNALAAEIHAANKKWWFQPDGVTPLRRNKGELLMLVVTELAEAMEGERKRLMDDKLPHRPMAEVEIADAIIRLLDYAAAYGYDLDGAIREKRAYNADRPDHKAEAARIAAGLQF
jgi:NTP pyrophosphatase (non-canonical NTP hydrolase)